MNRKGAVLLRDIIFMLIIFGGVLTLASIFALDMAAEYSNTNMTSEYSDDEVSGLGSVVSKNIKSDVDIMRNATASGGEESKNLIGAFGNLGGFLAGASEILGTVFKSPVLIGNTLETLMISLQIPSLISVLVGNMVIGLIYALVIFVLISAALRGGKL